MKMIKVTIPFQFCIFYLGLFVLVCLCMHMTMPCHAYWGQRTTKGVSSLCTVCVLVSNLGSQAWRQPYLRVGGIFGCHSRYKEVKGNRGAACLPLFLVGRCIYSAAAAAAAVTPPHCHSSLPSKPILCSLNMDWRIY